MKLKCRCGQIFETDGAAPGTVIRASCCGRRVKIPQKSSPRKQRKRKDVSAQSVERTEAASLFGSGGSLPRKKKKKKAKQRQLRPIFHLGFMRGDWVTVRHLQVCRCGICSGIWNWADRADEGAFRTIECGRIAFVGENHWNDRRFRLSHRNSKSDRAWCGVSRSHCRRLSYSQLRLRSKWKADARRKYLAETSGDICC